MEFLIVTLLAAVLLVLVLGYRKLCRVDRETWLIQKNFDQKLSLADENLYRQIEGLINLRMLLSNNHPLPPLRGWAGSPDFLVELANIVMERKPQIVLECSSGSSTLVAARCCQLNGVGHVYSLEHEVQFAEVTRRNLLKSGLEQWATVIYAPLEPIVIRNRSYLWYDTSKLPELSPDFLIVDGPPGSLNPMARYPAGERLIPMMSERAVVIVDDAKRPDEARMVELWMSENPGFNLRRVLVEKGLSILEKC